MLDVTDVLRRLARLRLAVTAVVVLALVVAGVAYLSADSSRQSRTAVVIVPPKVSGVAGGNNPLLNLDNNLAQLAVVLQGTLGSPAVSRALSRDGATAEFSVTTVTGDNPSFSQLTPQLVFTVTGDDDAVTERTATALVTQAGVALRSLQDRAGVPAASRASVVEVSPPSAPVAVSGGRLRSAGALGVGIVVLGLLLVLAVDALRRRRLVPLPAAEPELPTLTRRGSANRAASAPARTATGPARKAPPLDTPAAAKAPVTARPLEERPGEKRSGEKRPGEKGQGKKGPGKKQQGKTRPVGAAPTEKPAEKPAQKPADSAPTVDAVVVTKAPAEKTAKQADTVTQPPTPKDEAVAPVAPVERPVASVEPPVASVEPPVETPVEPAAVLPPPVEPAAVQPPPVEPAPAEPGADDLVVAAAATDGTDDTEPRETVDTVDSEDSAVDDAATVDMTVADATVDDTAIDESAGDDTAVDDTALDDTAVDDTEVDDTEVDDTEVDEDTAVADDTEVITDTGDTGDTGTDTRPRRPPANRTSNQRGTAARKSVANRGGKRPRQSQARRPAG